VREGWGPPRRRNESRGKTLGNAWGNANQGAVVEPGNFLEMCRGEKKVKTMKLQRREKSKLAHFKHATAETLVRSSSSVSKDERGYDPLVRKIWKKGPGQLVQEGAELPLHSVKNREGGVLDRGKRGDGAGGKRRSPRKRGRGRRKGLKTADGGDINLPKGGKRLGGRQKKGWGGVEGEEGKARHIVSAGTLESASTLTRGLHFTKHNHRFISQKGGVFFKRGGAWKGDDGQDPRQGNLGGLAQRVRQKGPSNIRRGPESYLEGAKKAASRCTVSSKGPVVGGGTTRGK